MRAFMLSGAHQRAMPKLFNWCDEASVVHWNQRPLNFLRGVRRIAGWSKTGGSRGCGIRPTHNEPSGLLRLAYRAVNE
jgi:hypothetical protein